MRRVFKWKLPLLLGQLFILSSLLFILLTVVSSVSPFPLHSVEDFDGCAADFIFAPRSCCATLDLRSRPPYYIKVGPSSFSCSFEFEFPPWPDSLFSGCIIMEVRAHLRSFQDLSGCLVPVPTGSGT